MKVSTQWLSEWVTTSLTLDALSDCLTMAGLEVDAIEVVGAALPGITVARVIDSRPHPDADRLSVCRVETGGGVLADVVCGAPNVRAGLVVAYAMPGAVLPDGRVIGQAVIRNITSAGMLCSPIELGLGEDSGGLLELAENAPIGTPISEYLKLNDFVIDVDLTPNRGDCLSIVGIAREIAALTDGFMSEIDIAAVSANHQDVFGVTLQEPGGCPRYAGRVIRNVNAAATSPVWMTERLRRAGVRSINAVVDVTNYVMLELGQPLHGFDLAHLTGSILVRNGRGGETLELLDGQIVELDANTLVIADEQRAVALAGVMGGADSGVELTTTDVFLESAYFDPITLAGVARHYKLHTDASHRFERGVDYTGQERAIERATALIMEICGGDPGPVMVAESLPDVPRRLAIELDPEQIEQTLGISMSRVNAVGILRRLHFDVNERDGLLEVTPPEFRFDVELQADLLEELARIHGYKNIPATFPSTTMALRQPSERRARDHQIRETLISQGYYEVITYSFIESNAAAVIAPRRAVHTLSNPISTDMAVMRPSLWPGLIKAATHNLNRQIDDIRLFELGVVFEQTPHGLLQRHTLAAIATGRALPEQWGTDSRNVDFYDVKQELEIIIRRLNVAGWEWRQGSDAALHPGQAIDLIAGGNVIGHAGVLHPRVARHFDLAQTALVFELDLSGLPIAASRGYKPISKFPSVRRDINIVLGQETPASDVMDAIRRAAGDSLRDLQLFDEYRGQGIDSDKKSLTIGLIFQASSSTLTDEEIEDTMKRVLFKLHADFGGALRN